MTAGNACPSGRLRIASTGKTYQGDYAQWSTVVPSDMALFGVTIPSSGMLVDPNARAQGYGLRAIWNGGNAQLEDSGKACCGGLDFGSEFGTFFQTSTRWFAIQVACNQATCPYAGQLLDVGDITLIALDGTPPTLAPDEASPNLADENGKWVRGSWDTGFTAAAQAGVCQAYVAIGGHAVTSTAVTPPTPGGWTQCGDGKGSSGTGAVLVRSSTDTSDYPNGPMTLEYYAADGTQSTTNLSQPGNTTAQTYELGVDNEPVSLSLSSASVGAGPDAPEQVTATASAGPSGVAGISCTVDGSPNQWHAGASESLTVQGVGEHTVSCYAQNRAIDAKGEVARSGVQTATLDIQEPTLDSVSFTRLVDKLRCSHRRERLRIPAHWVTERYHGHKVRVHVPAQTRTTTVVHCHPRIVKEHRVVNGREVIERVVELPHLVQGQHDLVPYGQGATVHGWLGDAGTSNALAGQPVQILTAPANGAGDFTPLETVRTNAEGAWSAQVPAGPSRVIEADFAGTQTLAPATSDFAHLTVRASPRVRVTPTHTRWGSTISISGRLRGGYVPPAGELVVLRIGWKGGSAEIGHVLTSLDGSFRTTYTFLRGRGSETYRIWAQSVRESDYPFAPARSRSIEIHVTG
jgi:hypothetical protein